MTTDDLSNGIVEFGRYEYIPERRILLRDGRPISVPSRAREILFVLVERAGELIHKRELMARVWPGRVVGEGALRVHITTLRKILGDGAHDFRYIESVSGQGYRFVAPVIRHDASRGPDAPPRARALAGIARPRMVGRETELCRLLESVPAKPIVTIIGPGGIGKTTLATAAADVLRDSFEDIGWVDLGSVASASVPGCIAAAVAASLECSPTTGDPIPQIAARLEGRRALLVLDNCEHVMDGVVETVATLLRLLPTLHILSTSREPLRISGEWVLRLGPLDVPATSAKLSAADVARFSAVTLFAQLAKECLGTFELRDADVPVVVEICRKLDGIPLAIELAAARVDLFGLAGLATHLDESLKLLTRGRRTSSLRHRTLRATLDWSYRALSDVEQLAFRRLSVFVGHFDLHRARALLADEAIAANDVIDLLASLEAKSLIVADPLAPHGLLHLLQTSRAYAQEKLADSPEHCAIRHRHAQLCCSWGARAPDWDPEQTHALIAESRRHIPDIRAALDWCFGKQGDAALGVQLTSNTAPFWFQLCLVAEYGKYLERALQTLDALPASDLELEQHLYATLGETRILTQGVGSTVTEPFSKALALGERLAQGAPTRRAYWGLWLERTVSGDYDAAIGLAQKYRSIAASSADPAALMISERIMTMAHHVSGNQAVARRHAENMLSPEEMRSGPVSHCNAHFDHQVAAHTELARILWLQGFPEQAQAAGAQCLERASALGHIQSLCRGLTAAGTIMIWVGEPAAARRFTQRLLECSSHHPLPYWNMWARIVDAAAAVQDDETAARVLADFQQDPRCSHLFLDVLGALNPRLITQQTIERALGGHAGACTPEILRGHAQQLLARESTATAEAEAVLRQSLDVAQRQGALSWELRSATTLAQIWHRSGRGHDARDLLAPIYGRFTEGHSTRDLVQARRILEA